MSNDNRANACPFIVYKGNEFEDFQQKTVILQPNNSLLTITHAPAYHDKTSLKRGTFSFWIQFLT